MKSILNAVKNLFKGVGRPDKVSFKNKKGEVERGIIVEYKGARRPRVVIQRVNGTKVTVPEGQYW